VSDSAVPQGEDLANVVFPALLESLFFNILGVN
jgi:hypothetical protein